jgi:hypothetical protein
VISNAIDVTDRAARLLGVPASFAIGTAQQGLAGNVSFTPAAGQSVRIKIANISTAAGGGNRIIRVALAVVSSKTAAGGLSNVDLLDRELVSNSGLSTDILNGASGDTWTILTERIV